MARYWIAQHVSDLFRNEPQNVGVLVEDSGKTSARFFGEASPNSFDGRKLRSFTFPDVYKQWVSFWRAESLRHKADALVQLSGSHYRVVLGGDVDGVDEGDVDSAATYLYSLLVSEGGFREAVAGIAEADELAGATLLREVTDAFKADELLERDGGLFVAHPVRRGRSIRGGSTLEHKPAFVQENGALYVMETVDFSVKLKTRPRDHAGWAAYVFKDIRNADARTEALAIVNYAETDLLDDSVVSGLGMLRNEATLVEWHDSAKRLQFLERCRNIARS
jgi:hypothetical protein